MAKLYFHYSTMNAGKSTLLLQVAHNYEERSLRPYLLKPAIDTRESAPVIGSRIGLSKPCHSFNTDENLFEIIDEANEATPIDCILVDEAQFASTAQVWELAQVVDELGIPVMTYGLRTDFQGNLFPGSATLMAIADVLREIRTIDESGKKATMVVRLNEAGEVIHEGPQNLVGGEECYKSVNRREWRRLMQR